MAKIHINNPKQVINGGAKKYYFKVKGLGGPKGDKGDKGDTGATGPQGPQGNAATVSIGSTTTLPVGYDATVTNSGSIYNAVLNFGIPQGPRGPQGATGATGAKGDKGDQGNPGPQGEKGTNATVYIGTTTTLNPGSQATVYNSGTDSNAVLNFGIPKGDKGDTGPMPTIAQETGQAIDQVMSQKATTDALNTKQTTITSSNKLSADLVTDTSTTNKFVTAEDKTNWNGKQDALTAGTGIDITGDVISTPAIVPEVVAELPTTGAEGKLYLTPKAHTTSTATGNPIEATITEQAGQLESFQLDGDTFQQSYTGKNLVGLINNTISQGGLTATVDGDTVTIDGTATGSVVSLCSANFNLTGMAGKKPAVSIFPISGSWTGGAIGFNLRNSSDSQVFYQQERYDGANFNANTLTSSALASADHAYVFAGSTTVFSNFKFKIMLSDSPVIETTYEPYTGGQPSPNPDYPQPIQTVTGEQTVTIVGKNLIDPDGLELGNIDASGNDSASQQVVRSGYIRVVAGSYMLKVNNPDNNINLWRYAIYDNSKTFVSANTPQAKSATITIANNGYIRVSFYNVPWKDLTVQEIIDSQVQLELGSTASSYTPYSKQTYPLDLGSIELCKLGNYQDYIFKDGDSWKVHKATVSAIIDGSESWDTSGTNTFYVANIYSKIGNSIQSASTGEMYASHFTIADITSSNTLVGASLKVDSAHNVSNLRIRLQDMSGGTAGFRQMLSAEKPSIYARRLTPTDTTITDTTLIAQLESIRTASLENGTSTITNTATGTNLAGDMEVGYYGYNPTNRYDKFIWLDLNNNYEQIGS